MVCQCLVLSHDSRLHGQSRASATIVLVFRTLRHCEPAVERELADALTEIAKPNCLRRSSRVSKDTGK